MRRAVFCSSRENIDERYKESARIIGEWIGNHSCTLVYGGVDKGLMHIVSSAVKKSGGRTVGIVPVSRLNLRNVSDDEMITSSNLNDRKNKMLLLSDLFIVLPGGYGTLDEFISTYTSLTFAGDSRKKIVLLNQNNLFDATLTQLQVMIKEGMMEEELLRRVKVVTTPQECCDYLEEYIQANK